MSIKSKFSPLGYLFPKTPQVQLTITCNISVDNIYLNGVSIAQNTDTVTLSVNKGLQCDIYATKDGYNDSLHENFIIYENKSIELNLSVSELETLYLTVNSGDDGKFIIPFNQYRQVAYNWKIDWGDGTGWKTYSGTGATNTGITYSNYEVNHNYTIKIKNNSSTKGWLQAFGFEPTVTSVDTSPSSLHNKDKVLLVDGILDKNMFLSNNIYNTLPDYTCAYMFQDCKNLKIGDDFNLPQDISNAGNYICQFMFQNCSSIDSLKTLTLPQNLRQVGENFCYGMFQKCTSLETMGQFNLSQSLKIVGNYTFAYMFENNTSLETLNGFNFPQTLSNAPRIGFAYCMFKKCTSLETLGDMRIPNIKSINNNEIIYSNFTYYDRGTFYTYTTSTVISYFEQTFYGCSSLKTGIIAFLSNWTNATQFLIDYHESVNFRYIDFWTDPTTYTTFNVNSRVFMAMFAYCTSIEENITSSIKPLSFIPASNITQITSSSAGFGVAAFSRATFSGCPQAYISTLDQGWK